MNMVYRSFSYLKSMYSQLNPATLTGAIDIVVVEQQDGTYLASPFHVRFGKLGVLRAKEKLVKITVNDERIRDLHMKLGDQGEAFFVQEVALEVDNEIPSRLITSPLPSRPETPTEQAVEKQKSVENNNDNMSPLVADDIGKRKRRKKRKKRTPVQPCEEGGVEELIQSEEDDKVFVVGVPEDGVSDLNKKPRRFNDSSEEKITDSSCNQSSIRPFLSDSEVPNPETEQEKVDGTIAPFSDSEATVPAHHTKSGNMMWGWGQLPSANESGQESSSDDSISKENASLAPVDAENESVFRTIASPEDVKLTAPTETTDKTKETIDTTALRNNANNNRKPPTTGLFLDDVLSLNPTEANLYLQQGKWRKRYMLKESSHVSKELFTCLPLKDEGNTRKVLFPRTQQRNMLGLTIEPATSRLQSSSKTSVKNPQVIRTVPQRAASPGGGSDIDSGTDSQTHEDTPSENVSASTIPDARISLCGLPSGSSTVDMEKFVEKEVKFNSFLQNPATVLNDPNLVFKVGDRYMNWQAAAPALVSLVVYKQPLTKENIDRFVQAAQPQQSKGLVSWFFRKPKPAPAENQIRADEKSPVGSSSQDCNAPIRTRVHTESAKTETESEIADILQGAELKRSLSEQSLYSNHFVFTSTTTIGACGKVLRKTTRLNSEQLASLGLKEGANKIEFSVTTQYQGTSKCQATIYLWKWYDKIVISDIDGTITKSDVFGQILPVVGKDWTQGGVAQLYQNIGRNGYKFMYLSARAIGQASMTKSYLNWIDQQGVCLPPGPLFLSPTSLMIAFRREVIEKKPEKFKIDCLKDIKALFPSNPFSAGFGNKTSDVISYSAVGIPSDRMFTINHKGELRREVMQTYVTSYNNLGETVDNFFPPLDQKVEHEFQARGFSDFSYWRDDVMTVVNEYDDFRLT